MPRTTTYTITTFSLGQRKKLQADPPIQTTRRADAVRKAERYAQSKVGVMVVEVTGDAEFEDYDEPVLVFKTGQLPPGIGDD